MLSLKQPLPQINRLLLRTLKNLQHSKKSKRQTARKLRPKPRLMLPQRSLRKMKLLRPQKLHNSKTMPLEQPLKTQQERNTPRLSNSNMSKIWKMPSKDRQI